MSTDSPDLTMVHTSETDVEIALTDSGSSGITIAVNGRVDYHAAAYLISEISRHIHRHKPAVLTIDLSQAAYFDDYGALALYTLERVHQDQISSFTIVDPENVTAGAASFQDPSADDSTGAGKKQAGDNFVEKIGQSAMTHAAGLKEMVLFVGSVFLSLGKIISNPHALRFGDTVYIMEKTGVMALPIVAMISYLLGLVIAFMSSLQLRQFGANIYVASLVAVGMVSELGPIMTAIVVSGRSGSAFAAEIGTMQISEEVDALSTMGFDPVTFLALPRIIASTAVVPILTLLSNIFAILGGLTVGIFLLDLTVTAYISQSLDSLTLFEILWGVMKSMVFAILISMVGCLRGFQSRGGADAVGNAATSAVVSGVFLIILFDSFFAVLRSYWW